MQKKDNRDKNGQIPKKLCKGLKKQEISIELKQEIELLT